MRAVSIGDLVTDYYYYNGKLLGVNGGMSSHNIIANLATMGLDTAVFSSCGNDIQGKIAIKSLEDLKVDVSNIMVFDNVRTRCFHVSYVDENNKLSLSSRKRCPFCNTKKWYDESLIDCEHILKNIRKDDVLVFDNLNEKNQTIIDKANCKKIIDIGQYFELEELSDEEIIEKIKEKFEIINFNERVTKYLVKRFELKSNLELYEVLSPKLMTITKGEKGAEFIYNNESFMFNLIAKSNGIDSTGAGDAFFSSIIKDWIDADLKFNVNSFENWYKNSNKLTSKVVSKMGARGHINPLYKIKKLESCTCDDFSVSERKKIKRCNININNLETRVLNAVNSGIVSKISHMNFNSNDNCLFIGTGGSYAGAYFASRVINNLWGCNTYALYPRDVLYRNNDNISKIVLFSYSGTTSDIITSVKGLDNKKKYVITKGEISKIYDKTNIPKTNILSYRTPSSKGKERGFLSFEGAVAPASIFLSYYLYCTNCTINVDSFIKDSMDYWDNKIDSILNKKIVKEMKSKGTVNLFRGDYSSTACFDLESKIIESGVFNCIIHEKKNFSHGRFINYENLGNTLSIYFKQNSTSNYEKELIKYLNNCIIVESRYDGILAEYDLLIASQYIIYYLGKILDIDVSKPNYTEEAMKIYFYKGDL